MTTYRITTQVVNADGTLGDLVDIVEMESNLTHAEASSDRLWQDFHRAHESHENEALLKNAVKLADDHREHCSESCGVSLYLILLLLRKAGIEVPGYLVSRFM